MKTGFWMLDIRYWMLDNGYWIMDNGGGIPERALKYCSRNLYQNKIRSIMEPDLYTNYRIPITDHRLPITDHRLPNTGHRIPVNPFCPLDHDYPAGHVLRPCDHVRHSSNHDHVTPLVCWPGEQNPRVQAIKPCVKDSVYHF
jgi:hypothetical protein